MGFYVPSSTQRRNLAPNRKRSTGTDLAPVDANELGTTGAEVMNMKIAIRTTLATTTIASMWTAKPAWAQVILERQAPGQAPETTATSGAMTTAVVVALGIAVLVIIAALAKMADLRRKRETEAVVVQSRISDAILRDPGLFNFPITPTARVPLWRGSPVTIEVAGQVPSEDIRQAALRLVEREAAQVRHDVQIESRVGVVPTMVQRSA